MSGMDALQAPSHILIHYGEIALKGNNRGFFEDKLVSNIRSSLSEDVLGEIRKLPGRIVVKIGQGPRYQTNYYDRKLSVVFGIENFSFAMITSQKWRDVKRRAWEMVKDKDFRSFKVETKRAQKTFPLTSMKANERLGAYLQEQFERKAAPKEVDLEGPDLIVFVEIVAGRTFLYLKKRRGPGGLPVTTAGKVVALLSAGIDSPVASWQIMKRGGKIIFCHFHTFPHTSRESQKNAEELVKLLSAWQNGAKLYLINIGKMQRKIIMDAPKQYRTLFYRRAMVKIATEIARNEGALGLVTGDSLAQVASQTLENLRATSEAVPPSLPIYRPNVGRDKKEIVKLAKQIGTYPISIRPQEDCCVYMRPKHPETKPSLDRVTKLAEVLRLDGLVDEAVSNAEIKVIS